MKGFWKIFGICIVAIAAIVGALVAIDRIVNKNRIKGNYLECDVDGVEEETTED